jgi:hypothetical protein
LRRWNWTAKEQAWSSCRWQLRLGIEVESDEMIKCTCSQYPDKGNACTSGISFAATPRLLILFNSSVYPYRECAAAGLMAVRGECSAEKLRFGGGLDKSPLSLE